MIDNVLEQDIKDKIDVLMKKSNLQCAGSEMIFLILLNIEDSMTSLIFKELNIQYNDVEKFVNECTFLRKSGKYTLKFNEIMNHSKDLMEDNYYTFDEAYLYSLLSIKDTVVQNIFKYFKIDPKMIEEELDNAAEAEEAEALINITKLAKDNKLNIFIGRNNYIEKMDLILNKKQKNNIMLIGNAGVGKTGLVEGLAQYYLINKPEITIYELDLGVLIAGTRYRGDLEEKIIEVLDEIKKKNVILFIDEIHNIISSSANEVNLDIANILKPVLARSEIKCIGATTSDEYYRYIEKDKALSRRFQNIIVEEVTDNECLDILLGIKKNYEDFYDIEYSLDNLKDIIEVSKIVSNRKKPDICIDILDEVGLMKSKKGHEINRELIKSITFEYLGINLKKIKERINSSNSILKKYFLNYFNLSSSNIRIQTTKDNKEYIIKEIKELTQIKEENILYIDFNDYIDNHYVANLIGSPAGYVGYEDGGLLTNHVLKYPFSLIVCNNYYNSSINIKRIIDRVLNTNKINDSKGRIIDFRNVMMVFIEDNEYSHIGFNKINNNIFIVNENVMIV